MNEILRDTILMAYSQIQLVPPSVMIKRQEPAAIRTFVAATEAAHEKMCELGIIPSASLNDMRPK